MTATPPKRIRSEHGKARWKLLTKRTKDVIKESKQDLKPLVKLLLDQGGDLVLLPIREPDLKKILKRGQLWEGGDQVHLLRMAASRCHENVAELYLNRQITAIATGYGMTKDPDGIRLWRQHSWGVIIGTDDEPEVVETTEVRDLYYGVILDAAEAEEFLQWNAPL